MLLFIRHLSLKRLLFSAGNPQRASLATVPSSGSNVQLVGQCGAEDSVPPRFPLATSIRLANSTVDELRGEFLHFFQLNQHTVVAPASIFPKRQEGSYFVNAGMNQFKPLFLGQTDSSTSTQFKRLRRATNCQPCIRIGGRHDDLNDVGYDRQHHTMFEMLGSWSFGDYHKAEACRLMWTFVTKVLGLPTNGLYVTYFGGCSRLGLPPDDETRNIWLNFGVSDSKIMPFGVEHNFWRAGQSSGAGLCGPATELHVDFAALSGHEGQRCARCLINSSSEQVVELWNTVFITHRLRATNGDPFTADLLEPLPKQFVDTGMGLERLACVMQGVTSTYDSDVFAPLIEFIQSKASTSSWTAPVYTGEFLPFCRQTAKNPAESENKANTDHSTSRQTMGRLLRDLLTRRRASRYPCPSRKCIETHPDRTFDLKDSHHVELLDRWHRDTAYRLIADHSRALAHSLADGLLPGRQGLSLKLRQLIHRATRAAILTGLDHEDAPVALLSSVVAEVARRNGHASMSNLPALQGPSARQPSCLSPEAMECVINQEVHSFLPRLHDIEASFQRCLAESPESNRLSGGEVRDLLAGKYGVPVSWDMICAQSHWAGLCLPDPGTIVRPPDEGPHPSHSQSNVRAEQLRSANFPTTDDSLKYTYEREPNSVSSAPVYVTPVCRSRIVGFLFPAQSSSATYILIPAKTQQTTSPVPTDIRSNHFGLLCERTNFFSPEGGQDCDVGLVRLGPETYQVDNVERIADSKEDGSGWNVHWCRPTTANEVSVDDLLHVEQAELSIDQVRRTQLMSNHTGQHLFVWALDTYMRGFDRTTAVQHHGGSVHPHQFTVNAAVIRSAEEADDLLGLVAGVETLCLETIKKNVPVSAVTLDWANVDKNKRVRRFPWMNYPSQVTAVCLGDASLLQPDAAASDKESVLHGVTAELCCGTHLHRTGDLFDLTVTSVRSRKQAVKEFTAVIGEPARAARLLGNSLLSEAFTRESRMNPSNLSSSIDWLANILSQTSPTNPSAQLLPFVAREKLEACLHRWRRTRAMRPSEEADDQLETVVNKIRTLEAGSHHPIIMVATTCSRPDVVVQALLEAQPLKPTVVCCGSLAVYYCPYATPDSSGTALNGAHAVALKLMNRTPAANWNIKARPLRSKLLNDSNRFKLAVWQISSSSNRDGSSDVEFWEQYHDHLRDVVASLAPTSVGHQTAGGGL